MQNGKCSKHFPKDFQEKTYINEDGYPCYCQPNDGRQHDIRGHMMDNRSVVPYCPWFLLEFCCHINVELTFNVRAVKYIHKYIYKGHDRTTMQFGKNKNDIQQYLDARYVSSHEACWRLLEYKMHVQIPAVMALSVHLDGERSVTYHANSGPLAINQRMESSTTKLMAFFDTNRYYPEAHHLLHVEFPEQYVWMANSKKWRPHQHDFSIERIHFAGPSSRERVLLEDPSHCCQRSHIFQDLRSFQGTVYPTFKAACLERGLLEDDLEWRLCLQEAAGIQTGSQLCCS